MEEILNLSLYSSVFIYGITSSFHCLVMCGPFVSVLRSQSTSKGSISLYHLGRAISYFFIGLFLGILGKGANSFGELSTIHGLSAFLSALFLCIMGIRLAFGNSIGSILKLPVWIQSFIQTIQRKFSTKALGFGIGMVSGFLPCGVLYPAYAASFATGSAAVGGLVMVSFFFGTVPALTSLGLVFAKLRQKIPHHWITGFGVVLILSSLVLLFYRFYSHSHSENCVHPI